MPSAPRRLFTPSTIGAVALLVLLTLLLFRPLLLNGEVLYFGDLTLYFTPLLEVLRQELGAGRIPLWNPYLLCGTPYIGNPQAWPLYPSALLAGLFRAEYVTGLIGVLHVLFAGLGTLAFLRRRGLSNGAALMGAVAWSFGGALVSKIQFPNMVQAAAYFPWLLWAVEGTVTATGTRQKAGTLGALALLTGWALLAAHTQVFLMEFYLGAVWALFRLGQLPRPERLPTFLRMALAFALGAGLSSAQLLPVVEFTRVTVRADLTLAQTNRFILPPYTALYNFLLPNFFGNPATTEPYYARGNFWEVSAYIGLLPFTLAVGAAVRLWRRSSDVRFWAVAAVVLVWLSLGKDALLYSMTYYALPGVRLFHDPARWLLPGTFALACLAAQGTESIAQTLKTVGKRRIFLAVSLLITVLDLLPFSATLNPTTPGQAFEERRRGKGEGQTGRVHLSNIGDYWAYYVSFRTYERIQGPKKAEAFISSGGPNLNVLARQPSLYGYEPVRRADMDRYLTELKARPSEDPLLVAAGVTEWQRFERVDGVDQIVSRQVMGKRATLWTHWSAVSDDKEALEKVLSPDWDGEPILTGGASKSGAGEPVELLVNDRTPQKVEIVLPAQHSGGLLVLSDTHGAGWTAFADDLPISLHTIDGLFRGVVVSPETRRVEFRYMPVSWRLGLFGSLCVGGILSGVFTCALAARRRGRRQ
jgi:hypothetical protein